MKENEVTVDFLKGPDDICLHEPVHQRLLWVLAKRGTIKLVYNSELAHKRMLQILHELMPSTYSEEVVLGLDGTDYSQLPKLAKPFDDLSDQHFTVTDDAILEVQEADYVSYEVCRTRRPPSAINAYLKAIREQSTSVLE